MSWACRKQDGISPNLSGATMILESQINPALSAGIPGNAAAMRAVVDDLRAHVERAWPRAATDRARQTCGARQALPREPHWRCCSTPGMQSRRYAPPACSNDAPSASLIAGGKPRLQAWTAIVCNDATVKGTLPRHRESICARREIASRTTPASTWWTQADQILPNQDEVFPDPRPFQPHLLQPGQHGPQGLAQIFVVMGSARPAAPACRR